MKKLALSCIIAVTISVASCTYSAETPPLPAPQKSGGIGLLDAFEARASGTAFTGAVTDAELATVLWAATGRNRDGGGWTVPMAMSKPPYVKVYVVGQNGVHLYDKDNHALIKISDDDIRGDLGQQGFTRKAYYNLIFAIDGDGAREAGKQNWQRLGDLAIGAMTEHVYLAAAALDLQTRFVMSFNMDLAKKALDMADNDDPIALLTLGRP